MLEEELPIIRLITIFAVFLAVPICQPAFANENQPEFHLELINSLDCLTGVAKGQPVELLPCDSENTAQLWVFSSIIPGGPGGYYIVNRASDYCLSILGDDAPQPLDRVQEKNAKAILGECGLYDWTNTWYLPGVVSETLSAHVQILGSISKLCLTPAPGHFVVQNKCPTDPANFQWLLQYGLVHK